MSGARHPLRRALAAGVVLAAILVLVNVRPTGVDVFFRRIDLGSPSGTTRNAASPDRVIAIRIDPETNATSVIDVTPPPPPPADTSRHAPTTETPEPPPPADLDVRDLLDQAGKPRTGASSPTVVAIPPRPVEITWPETRRLKHCIGRSVEVRILVGEDGRAQQVDAMQSSIERDCLDAALDAARRIKFEPGRSGGIPAAMWTRVRIDFERKD